MRAACAASLLEAASPLNLASPPARASKGAGRGGHTPSILSEREPVNDQSPKSEWPSSGRGRRLRRADDNDLIVIRDPGAAAKFDAHFERMWDAAEPIIEFRSAINALEPK